MKCKLVTMTNSPYEPGLAQLRRSLDKFKWDYEVITNAPYIAYGSKQIAYYNYILSHPEISHIFAVDAHDIFMLGTMEESLDRIENKDSILLCAEKGCYPYSELAKEYPEEPYPWKYVNGGAAFANTEMYKQMLDDYPIKHADNDQANLTDMYLNYRDKYNIKIDNSCKVFQSIAFESPEEFDYQEDKLTNNLTGSTPTIIHGNGKTSMINIYNLLH